MSNSAEDDDDRTVAIVLQTLFSGPPTRALPKPYPLAVRTALEWQELAGVATFSEMHAVRTGVVLGRLSEVVGRAAAAGEQLGLAWTCLQDAKRWLDPTRPQTGTTTVAARALAEMAGYYAVSAAHGLGNITLRTLLISPSAASTINSKYPAASGFPPYAAEREAWRPLSTPLATTLTAAAATVRQLSVDRMVEHVNDLLRDGRWVTLTSRRDVDFHRWRPQSVPEGASTSNPWTENGGASVLTGYARSQHQPPNVQVLVNEASDGLDALAEAMSHWLADWPEALHDLGTPVFKT